MLSSRPLALAKFVLDEHREGKASVCVVCVCVWVCRDKDKGLLEVELIFKKFVPVDFGVVQV